MYNEGCLVSNNVNLYVNLCLLLTQTQYWKIAFEMVSSFGYLLISMPVILDRFQRSLLALYGACFLFNKILLL